MGSCSFSTGKTSYWLQVVIQEKGSSNRKRRGKVQGLPSCKWHFIAKGIDYGEIFSPIVRHTSIRGVFALIASNDMILEHMDVRTTFLHGNLEEHIYTE